jgi:TrmH family RNA methyltransferase
MITSVSNSLVKLVAGLSLRKNRLESKLFIAEGIHLAQEALKAGADICQYFWTPKLTESGEGRELLALLEECCEGFEVHEAVMAKMAETEHPQGILLTVRFPKPRLLDLNGGFTLGLVLDGLQDPGNTGTIIRTAWAAGANGLLFTEGSADPYQGKVVRASMGGIFHLPIYLNLLPETIIRAAAGGVQLIAADAAAPLCYTEADLATVSAPGGSRRRWCGSASPSRGGPIP